MAQIRRSRDVPASPPTPRGSRLTQSGASPMNGWANWHERKLLFHLVLTPASHGPRVEGRAVGDAREDAVEALAGAWAGPQRGNSSRQGSGEGLGDPGRGLTSHSAGRVKWCMGRCFSRMLTEVSGREAGHTASVVGQQPRPRTSGRRRSAPRWRVPSPRWEEVSERVITVYESVLRDDRAGEWPVLEVGAEVQTLPD